jgi:hypothetical protein
MYGPPWPNAGSLDPTKLGCGGRHPASRGAVMAAPLLRLALANAKWDDLSEHQQLALWRARP